MHPLRRPILFILAATVGMALLAAGALRLRQGGPHRDVGTEAARFTLPDPPSPQEQALLGALAAARPGDPLPGRQLGEFYLQAARPFEALWAYAFAAHAAPADPDVNVGTARALEATLLYEPAIARLRAVLAREPGRWDAAARLAELYLRTDRTKAALSVIEAAGASDRASEEGVLLEGRVREALGDAAGAERAYRRVLAQGGEQAATWHRLGLLALSQGRRSRALPALRRARSLDPREARYAVDLGRVLAAGGSPADREAAMALYREAVRDRPYAPAFYESGLLLAAQKRFPQAAEGFARATEVDPGFAVARRELARMLELAGRRAEAHYERGLYYSAKDLRARSLREYLAMAAADPNRPDGLLMASQSHFKMSQRAQGAARAREAVARHPGDRAARERLAVLLIVIHDRHGARRLCEKWLREEPGAVPPLWFLGRIATEELRLSDGIRYYEQALAKEPENADILESLGRALVEAPGTEHLPRAIETLARAVTLAPENAQARHELGLALMRSGRLEEAQRQLLRTLDLDPHHGETYNVIVQLARRRRQPGVVTLFGTIVRDTEDRLREELALWRRTWDEPADAAGYVALARFLVRTAEPRKAESQLEQALAMRPNWPDVEAELARVRRLLAVQD